MISYKLAKQLKDAGFPQRWTMGIFYAEDDAEFKMIAEYQHKLKFCDNAEKYIDIPTLSELIKACGDKLDAILFFGSKWKVGKFGYNSVAEKTLEEAVARLWLENNRKKKI